MAADTTIWHNGQLLATLLEDVPAQIDFDRWGVAGGSLHYQCMYDVAPGLVQQVVIHPTFPWLIRDTASIVREEANLARVQINFKGVPPTTNQKTYRLSAVTESQPIESHKDFITKVGGTPDSPKNGAVFDRYSKFIGFQTKLSDGSSNPKAGIRSYLSPSLSYEEIWVNGGGTGLTGTLANLGKIDSPPSSNCFPTGLDGRNFLLAAGDAEQVGTGLRITRKWRLSGKRGWDTDIYNT